MRNIFNTISRAKTSYNWMDKSHSHLTTFKMGQLVPTLVEETMPGDQWNIQMQAFYRMPAQLAPVFHDVFATTHFFYTPYRLLWPNWDSHMTGKNTHTVPYVDNLANDITEDSLANYLGMPTEINNDTPKFTCFDIAALAKIHDDYYMSDALGTAIFTELSDGDNNAEYSGYYIAEPFSRSYNHDYFTTALPTSQQGAAVSLPLLENDTADVVLKGSAPYSSQLVRNATSGAAANWNVDATGGSPTGTLNNSGTDATLDPNGSWEVDINAEATDIRTLRRAFKLQEFLEASIRVGTRMNDWLWGIFGVKSPDATLDRAEYIGGLKQPVVFSEVLATAESTGVAVGDLSGHAISVGGSGNLKHYCSEYGLIMGITNVQPRTSYYQGIHRRYFRDDRLDWPIPHFANIGEQEIYQGEIYGAGNGSTLLSTWGYAPRYAEWKTSPNRISGEFRSTLEYWHLGRKFSAAPTLNETFLQVDPADQERIFAVSGEHHLQAKLQFNIKVKRKLPFFGDPSI